MRSTSDRFHTYYTSILAQDLLLKTSATSVFQLPRLDKIVLNSTSNQYVVDRKFGLSALLGLELITGQRAKFTCAKRSLAPFKIREKQFLGAMVTLRKKSLLRFLQIATHIYFPRIRDITRITSPQTESTISRGMTNVLLFPQLENHFEYFQHFRGFTMTVAARCAHPTYLHPLLSAYQFPIY